MENIKQTKDGRDFNRYLCFDIYFKNIELEMIEKTSVEKKYTRNYYKRRCR